MLSYSFSRLTDKEMDAVCSLRKILNAKEDATETLMEMLSKSKSNADLVGKVDSWVKLYNK